MSQYHNIIEHMIANHPKCILKVISGMITELQIYKIN